MEYWNIAKNEREKLITNGVRKLPLERDFRGFKR
jgi:hypothetical protein